MNQHTIKKLALTVVAVGWLGGALQAGVDDMKTRIDNERISLDLKDAPLVKVFEVYRALLGVEVRIRCEQERRLTIAFENITVRTSLSAICESAGLRWSIEASEPPVLLIECRSPSAASQKQALSPVRPDGKPVAGSDWVKVLNPDKESADRLELVLSIELHDAELETVLRMAAQLLDAKLVMDIKLGGATVNLSLEKSTMRQFLDAVCAQLQAKWELTKKDPRMLMVEKAF
ncbi:MAG: hypothetical protein AB1714_06260 [Acidobacteriota bacterium]